MPASQPASSTVRREGADGRSERGCLLVRALKTLARDPDAWLALVVARLNSLAGSGGGSETGVKR